MKQLLYWQKYRPTDFNKIILLPGDQLVSVSVDANAFDAIASILSGVA